MPQQWQIAPVFRAEGVREASQLSQTYFRTGRSREEQAYLVSAEDYYRQAIQLDPENVEARNALGVLLVLQGRLDKAIATLRAAPLTRNRAYVLGNLGYMYRLAGRQAEAADYLDEASQIDRENIWIDDRLVFAWQQRSQQAPRKTASPSKIKTKSRTH